MGVGKGMARKTSEKHGSHYTDVDKAVYLAHKKGLDASLVSLEVPGEDTPNFDGMVNRVKTVEKVPLLVENMEKSNSTAYLVAI